MTRRPSTPAERAIGVIMAWIGKIDLPGGVDLKLGLLQALIVAAIELAIEDERRAVRDGSPAAGECRLAQGLDGSAA